MLTKLWLPLLVVTFFLLANASFAADSININTATQSQLETLPGVGSATAKAIIEYRQLTGGFATVAELENVKGIGTKKLARFAEQLVVEESH